VTVQVADGANGLGKNLKFAGSFSHCSIPNLRGEYLKAPDFIRLRFSGAIIRRITLAGQGRKLFSPYTNILFISIHDSSFSLN
jgi:hypothetical protein